VPFAGRVNVHPDTAALRAESRAREVRCLCEASPFCRGLLSSDWLSCNSGCRACKASPWQPPTIASIQTGSEGLDAEKS
jgi:hypothetical protein